MTGEQFVELIPKPVIRHGVVTCFDSVMPVKFKQYSDAEASGWLGWLENANGDVVGFVTLEGDIRDHR